MSPPPEGSPVLKLPHQEPCTTLWRLKDNICSSKCLSNVTIILYIVPSHRDSGPFCEFLLSNMLPSISALVWECDAFWWLPHDLYIYIYNLKTQLSLKIHRCHVDCCCSSSGHLFFSVATLARVKVLLFPLNKPVTQMANYTHDKQDWVVDLQLWIMKRDSVRQLLYQRWFVENQSTKNKRKPVIFSKMVAKALHPLTLFHFLQAI